MSKVDKKKAKLLARIDAAELELRNFLHTKRNGAAEINLPKHRERIAKMVQEWQAL